MNAITISRQSDQVLELEWTSSASHDMIADSALGVLSGMDSNFATIKSECRGEGLEDCNQVSRWRLILWLIMGV
jgi:hypothetical protein